MKSLVVKFLLWLMVGRVEQHRKFGIEYRESYRALFIGGPWHREYRLVHPGEDIVPCDPGEYSREYLGFQDHIFHEVYVWSGMSFDEALDHVIVSVASYEDRQ